MGIKNKVQLITYPDSLGGDLKSLSLILDEYFKGLFSGGIHILPPFPSSGDRGFSPRTYFQIEPDFGDWKDIREIGKEHDILLDIMVNHISAESPYFLDYLENGSDSEFADMFLQVKKIWPDEDPSDEEIGKIFLRRTVPFSEYMVGKDKVITRLWTSFGKTTPSDQVDLDVNSEVTKKLFVEIFKHFAENDVKIVRLDAVGYVNKKPGTSCFFVKPEIFEFLNWIRDITAANGIELLPEVHAEIQTQLELSKKGFWIYDFVLPYLILEALLTKNSAKLKEYLQNRPEKQFTMLDCHDGIPVKPDLNGFYQTQDARHLVKICEQRGGNFSRVFSPVHKDGDGFDVHQIRGTYYSMLNAEDDAYFAARAIQFFTPGIPQVYYVGLLAGENDLPAVEKTGEGREINRHSYSLEEIKEEVKRPIVQKLKRLIEFRNSYPAFDGEYSFDSCTDQEISITWENGEYRAALRINLAANTTEISWLDVESQQAKIFV